MKRNHPWWILGIAVFAVLLLVGCETLEEYAESDGGTAVPGSVVIVNNTDKSINALYYAEASSSAWGANRIQGSTIPSGERYVIEDLTPATYDFKVIIGSGGAKVELKDYTLKSGENKEWLISLN